MLSPLSPAPTSSRWACEQSWPWVFSPPCSWRRALRGSTDQQPPGLRRSPAMAQPTDQARKCWCQRPFDHRERPTPPGEAHRRRPVFGSQPPLPARSPRATIASFSRAHDLTSNETPFAKMTRRGLARSQEPCSAYCYPHCRLIPPRPQPVFALVGEVPGTTGRASMPG